MEKTTVSVGICAFNEESNIAKLLESTINQDLKRIQIIEIIVVSSASTDMTDSIVESFVEKDSRISLVKEDERRGKASAVSIFLSKAKGEICVIQSADTISYPDTIENICLPLIENPEVGAVGGQPIPILGKVWFVNFAVSLIWSLHHEMSSKYPKLGEISAHRNIIPGIPVDAQPDDSYIEYVFKKKGYQIAYAPEAKIRNMGPQNISEYLNQRSRVRGHQIRLRKQTGHVTASGKHPSVLLAVAKRCMTKPWQIPIIFPVCLLELIALRRGTKQANSEDGVIIWDRLPSTKDLNQS